MAKMKKFRVFYASLAITQQIILSLMSLGLSKAYHTITFTDFKAIPTLIFIVPHLLSVKLDTFLLISISLLTIQNCYLLSIFAEVTKTKIISLLSFFIKVSYEEPIIMLICNVIFDLIFFIFYKINKRGRSILVLGNILVSVLFLWFVNFDLKLIIGYIIIKCINTWGYFCETDNLETFLIIVMMILYYIIFYLVHNGVFISNLNFNF